MNILAIETSCDETAVSVVQDGWKVLSNVIGSQIDIHAKTGGVVPEVAAREHVRVMIPIVDEAIRVAFGPICVCCKYKNPKSQILNSKHAQNSKFKIHNGACSCSIDKIDCIAVTVEPGLATSLLVGTETAKYLGYIWDKEVIEVNHVKGHVAANWLERDPSDIHIAFPVLCLSVSGGHNELILVDDERGFGSLSSGFEIIGESTDDAAGEAFDKVARILGLGYPGGPAIQKIASEFRVESSGLRDTVVFSRAWLNENNSNKWDRKNLNFSFSGLKSEVQREVQRRSYLEGEDPHPHLQEIDQIEIAFAFQEAVCDVLSEKLIEAVRRYGANEVHLAGGVSANRRLREMMKEKLDRDGMTQVLRFPESIKYCTDNAAMIGAAAFHGLST
jgi:N6-L-threonylcarbamoyladenine synthase